MLRTHSLFLLYIKHDLHSRVSKRQRGEVVTSRVVPSSTHTTIPLVSTDRQARSSGADGEGVGISTEPPATGVGL